MSTIFTVILALSACQVSTSEIIDNEKLQELLKNDKVQLIDVRTPEEWSYGIIDGATKIDYYDPEFMKKLEQFKKDQPIVLYCAAGGRSAQAAGRLKQAGFREIYDLGAGYRGWKAAGLPTVD